MNLQRLRQRRDELGFKQDEFDLWIGVGKGTYYRWEKGVHPLPAFALKVIAQKLEVSADWLLGLVSERESHLVEEGLSGDERILIARVRAGKMQEAVASALDLAQGHHQTDVSGMEPTANG